MIAQNSFFYLPDKYINWPAAKIDVQSERLDDYNWLLKLKASSAIKDIYIEMPFDAQLSDNFFDLLTDESKTVTIRTEEAIDDLPEKISLTSVNSIFSALTINDHLLAIWLCSVTSTSSSCKCAVAVNVLPDRNGDCLKIAADSRLT